MGVLFPLGVSEVARLGSESDDQVVITEHTIFEVHLPRIQIDAGHFIHQGGDVFLRGQNTPQRLRDFRHGQTRGGHLIEQRLEEMMVPAVDQSHPETLVGQLLGAGQASETTTKNENMFCRHGIQSS